MTVKFLNIKIENFKSIENLEIQFGDTTRIYGANETGKTSVADAIAWVLTGKNSLGESTFNIIPTNSVGISPSVELKLSIDDKTPTLKRVLKAKVGRDKSFTGDYVTECYVNGLKCTQRDFEGWIAANICDPEIFKLIHDVRYFTENISTNGRERPWEARRRLLTSVCGLESDEKIALLTERFKPIAEKLKEYDDATQLHNRLKAEIAETGKILERLNDNIWFCQEQMKSESGNAPVGEKEELLQKKQQLEQKRDDLLKEYNFAAEERNNQCYSLGQASVQAGKKVSEINSALNDATMRLNTATENYEKYGIACPTCGRKFARGFAEQKKAEYDAYREKMEAHIEKLKSELMEAEKCKEFIDREYKDILEKPKPVCPAEVDDLNRKIFDLSAKIANAEGADELKRRRDEQIKGLCKERDELSARLSAMQRDIDLCRDFLSYKADLTERKVNSMFDGVTFEMFRKNKVDGELRDVCEIFWNGVPYAGLSYSTKFITSMKIVKAFQERFDISFPCIVDNAESITMPESNDMQMILLSMRDENCPVCGSKTGRKEKDGYWHCEKCGEKFYKKLEVR